jgi:hypothetical protein
MGFQLADVGSFAREIAERPGVTGGWILPAPEDRGCMVWVAVKGLDDQGYKWRMEVRNAVESYIDNHRVDMRLSGFLFDYRLIVDEEALGPPQIPAGAIDVTVAAWRLPTTHYTEQDYLDHARHNERFLDYLIKSVLPSNSRYADWALVVCFYTALHYTKAAILRDHGDDVAHHVSYYRTGGDYHIGHNDLVREHLSAVKTAYRDSST